MLADERLALAVRAAAQVPGDALETSVIERRLCLTRFTHNEIHQNLDEAETFVQFRAVVDGRAGWACTNLRDEDSLERARDRAIAQARFAPAPAVPVTLPQPASYDKPENSFDAATANAAPSFRAAAAAKIFEIASRGEAWAAGYVATESLGIAIANSNGLRASFSQTDAAINTKCLTAGASGYAESFSRSLAGFDASAVARRAVAKARDAGELRTPEVGSWTVIVEPPALGELLSYLLPHFSAQWVYEGASFLADGLDRKYVSEGVTLTDDYAHPLHATCPFDGEGTPTQRVTFFENGVAKDYVTDSHWAARMKRRNTGHYLSGETRGPQPRAPVLAPGKRSRDELIASTKRGILISRFWYIRVVDLRKAIVTGMTRDGTFLIEDGKVTHGLRNMRFNVPILDLLAGCELSNEQVRTGSYSYTIVVPTAKFERFTFSSVTSY
jgi:PmbA protein